MGNSTRIRAVHTLDKEFVALKFIESFNCDYRTDEEKTLDKLKGATLVRIKTLSGTVYSFSLEETMLHIRDTVENTEEMWDIFFNSWLHEIGTT